MPFLYVIMIIASIMVPTFWTLTLVMVLFGWMSMTWYMRTSTYKEKTRDYVHRRARARCVEYAHHRAATSCRTPYR